MCILLSGQSLLYISGNIRPWKHLTLPYPNCAQGRLRLDFMNVKFDLSLLWVHMSKGAFSHTLQLFFRHDITKINLFKYTENLPQKMIIFRYINSDIFHISAQNIDCGYSLELPRQCGSNEYPQSMIWAEIRKIMYTPVNPGFIISKRGLRGSTLYRRVSVMKWYIDTVNILKFPTLYSILFWPKLYFLWSYFLKYLMEWQTV